LVLTSIPAITKDRDLLHILIDHIAERIPDCDLILVHDDDLARIDGIHDRDASVHPISYMCSLTDTWVTGNPPIECGDTPDTSSRKISAEHRAGCV